MTPASRWSARKPVLIGLLTVAALLGGLGGWGLLASLSAAIVAPGQIEVAQNRQVVQHPDGGVVREIDVVEGSQVAAGDILIRLDGTQIKSELAIVENQLFELLARRGRLEAERDDAAEVSFPPSLISVAADRKEVLDIVDGQRNLFAARGDTLAQQLGQLDERVKQIDDQIAGIDAQSAAMTAQLSLLNEELLDQQELLAKGLAQSARVLGLQREVSQLQGEVGKLRADRAQAEGRITEFDIEKLNLSAERREEANSELRDVAYRELELSERRNALIEKVNRLDVRAPVSGIVLGLQVTAPQSVLKPADPVLYLIPQDRPLIITAKVPTIHVDQVFVGQPVRLHFSAFSARTTPELQGHVTLVSADALKDERTQVPFYKIEVTLDPGELQKLDGQTLVPGMPVEAFIRTGERSPMSYLLKPFLDYFNRAFRET